MSDPDAPARDGSSAGGAPRAGAAGEERAAGTAGAASAAGGRSGLRWLPLTGLVILLDQLTKAVVEASMSPYDSITVLPVLDITRLHNTGAAFSLLADQDGWQRWFFVVLALVVSGVMIGWLRALRARSQALLCAAAALIVGGALGNVIDRLRLGYVIDFVHVHWNEAYFPAFNVADSAITVGAALLLLDAFLDMRRSRGTH